MSDTPGPEIPREAPTPYWRLCEIAWGSWLRAGGLTVTPLSEITGNSAGSQAPMIHLPGGKGAVPAPDFQTSGAGSVCYWEVKSRLGPTTDPLTGVRRHWIERRSFVGYLRLSAESGIPVFVVVHERATPTSHSRWLQIKIEDIRSHGTRDSVTAADGTVLDVVMWPVDRMAEVGGPSVVAADAVTPVLPRSPESDDDFEAALELYERALRRVPDRAREHPPVVPAPIVEPTGAARDMERVFKEQNPLLKSRMAGLEVLRRKLGIPLTPRYSVLRIGDVDPEVLGLLDYGIRVFVVAPTPISIRSDDPRMKAFTKSRLLEWAIIPDLPPEQEHWLVDGRSIGDEPEWLDSALTLADAEGGMNMRQYWIVHAPTDSDILVTAGAGTGKTETMSERLMFLLTTAQHVDGQSGQRLPRDLRMDEVAMVTFTNEAAREMRTRLARTVALRQRLCPLCVMPTTAWLMQLGRAQISTIHSFAKRIIQIQGADIGMSPDVTISNGIRRLDTLIVSALSEQLAPLYRASGRAIPAVHLWQKHIRSIWETLQNNGIRLFDPVTADSTSQDCIDWGNLQSDDDGAALVRVVRDVIERVRLEFAAECQRDQTLPAGQLVPTALRSLRAVEDPERMGLRFLFIDEFQDTDTEQMDMLLRVREALGARLFVVGDSKQGVYRFRGAEGNAFDELKTRVAGRGLPSMQEFRLTRNFRSGRRLLDSLNPYFRRWGSRGLLPYDDADRLLHNPMRTSEGMAARTVKISGNPSAFADEAARIIKTWRERHPTERIAILCRRNHHAMQVQAALDAIGEDCDLLMGGSFFQCPAVVEMRALLEAVLDPQDDAALLELMQSRWGVGLAGRMSPPGRCDDEAVWSERPSAVLTWRPRFATAAGTGSFDRRDLDDLRKRVVSLASMRRTTPAMGFIVLCRESFLPDAYSSPRDVGDAKLRRYRRCLDHLITLMDQRFADSPVTLLGLLEWLRLQIAINRNEDEPYRDEAVVGETIALTVHKAKGMEFDRVLIPNTWTAFGAPTTVKTSTAIVRDGTGATRLLWKWRPDDLPERTNSSLADGRLWAVDEREIRREETRLLYVAMTRAKTELRMLLPRRASPDTWAGLLEMT